MAFMEPQYTHDVFYAVEERYGTTMVPGDLVGSKPKLGDFRDYVESGEPQSFEKQKGWYARLSAPGYMDATDWDGPFKTEKEARQHIMDTYDVDPDTGDKLEENPKRGLVNPKTLPTYSVLHGGLVEQWMNKRGQWVHFKYRALYKTQKQAVAAVQKFHPRLKNYGLFPNSVPRTFKKKRKVKKNPKGTKHIKNAINVRSLVSRALK